MINMIEIHWAFFPFFIALYPILLSAPRESNALPRRIYLHLTAFKSRLTQNLLLFPAPARISVNHHRQNAGGSVFFLATFAAVRAFAVHNVSERGVFKNLG